MEKLVLKHSRIEINNYEIGDCPNLEYTFSIYDHVYHKTIYKAIEYDSENSRLFIPRGMNIEYLKKMFLVEPYVDYDHDPYVDTEPIPIKYLTRDDRQMEILKFILGKDKYSYTKSKSQLCINATTGSGKTFITVGAMCFTGSRIIIITSALNWLTQWKDKILEYTPLTSDDIYMISGSSSINKILARDPLKYQVFLISHSTIKSYGDKNGWYKVDEFFKKLQCRMKIFDEAHLYFDNMARIDFHSNTKKTIYLTATPERSDRDENVIYQQYFKNVPSISLFDENTDPHVHYRAIHINTHPTPMQIQSCSNQYGFDRNKYTDYVCNNPIFLDFVIILMNMLMGINGKILIYIGTNAGINKVVSHILNKWPWLGAYIGIYTSITPKEEKQESLKRKFIFSTTKSCGAASDIAHLQCTVNLAEPFKSSVLAQQTLGRCRADNTLYIDIVDEGFYFTKKYYRIKKSIFAQYAKSISDVYMDENELYNKTESIENDDRKIMCMHVFKD